LAVIRYLNSFIKLALALAFVDDVLRKKLLTDIIATINEALNHGQRDSLNLHLQIINPRGEFLVFIGVATNVSPMTKAIASRTVEFNVIFQKTNCEVSNCIIYGFSS